MRRSKKYIWIMLRPTKLLWLALVLLAACSAGEIKPVPIEDGDMCSSCKMAISEKQFAAEIITEDEQVLKFDDIACLLRYQKAQGDKLKAAAIFVTDYETRQWLRAEDAFFSRSETVKTPMGGGILAFGDRSKAGSEVLKFADLKH